MGETEAKRHDHWGPGAWLSSLGHHTLLAALAVPEQVSGTLATSPFGGAKPETQASGERVCEYAGRRGSGWAPRVKAGGVRSGVGMPRARGGAAALSAAAEPPVSSARVEPEPPVLCSPARSLSRSLPPFLPPFLPAAAAALGKRRRGVALPWKNAALPRGQNPTQSPHGLNSPSPGDPTAPVADSAPEQLEVIGIGKAGRAGTCTRGRDKHSGSQTDTHPPTGAQRCRESPGYCQR